MPQEDQYSIRWLLLTDLYRNLWIKIEIRVQFSPKDHRDSMTVRWELRLEISILVLLYHINLYFLEELVRVGNTLIFSMIIDAHSKTLGTRFEFGGKQLVCEFLQWNTPGESCDAAAVLGAVE